MAAIVAGSLVFAVLAVITLYEFCRDHESIRTTKELALTALSQAHEWTKWMALIQAGVAGGLVSLLFKDGNRPAGIFSCSERYLALSVFVVMGFALFCSAWILASLPSQALRLEQSDTPSTANDIYEKELFGWLSNTKYLKKIKLGYMMTLQHWLWALGLGLSAALFYAHLFY